MMLPVFSQPHALERISLLRVLLGFVCFLLLIFGPYHRYYVDMATVIFKPNFPFYGFPALGENFWIIKGVAIIFSVLFTFGAFARFSCIMLTVSMSAINFYVMSFRESYAVETNHIIFFLLALCLLDTAKYYSVDAKLTKKIIKKDDRELASFVLTALILYVGMLYFQAGSTKLINSGWQWFSTGYTIYVTAAIEGTKAGQYLTQFPSVFPVLGVLTALFEFSFLPLLMLPRLWPYLAVAAVCFHVGTYVVLGISFWFLWLLFVPLFFTRLPSFHKNRASVLVPLGA
jgi:uncharacterized membrane protein YphA (DoxX/SURF4 family)